MKKIWTILCLSCMSLISTTCIAGQTPQKELSQRLAKNNQFHAEFDQKVISPEGKEIMTGSGNLDIQRPSLFRWHTTYPDDNLLVSDGKTVWYYSPFIEQVSIYNQDQATAQTPFILLTRNRVQDWANYSVTQKNDQFTLVPTAADSTQGQFQIMITAKGIVKAFNVTEQDGQQSQFTFKNVSLAPLDKKLFSFTIPKDTEIDDQRN